MTEHQLSLNGDAPVRSTHFSPWPSFPQDEIDLVTAVLQSGKVNYCTGQEGREFEKGFAVFHQENILTNQVPLDGDEAGKEISSLFELKGLIQ